MPKIAEKAKVLGGRADVVRYASGTSSGAFFYREWNRTHRKEDESPIEFVHPTLRISVEQKKERTEEIALINGTYTPTSRYTVTRRYKKPISRYKKEDNNGS